MCIRDREESVVISDGRYAAEVLADGFETQPAEDGSFTLPGVVSRKKQFIPALMTAYQAWLRFLGRKLRIRERRSKTLD